MSDIFFYDRTSRQLVKETVMGDRLLRIAYETPARHVLTWPLFKHVLATRFLGWMADRPSSVKRIRPTIQSLQINMDDFVIPDGGFSSFNQFFARHIQPDARPFPKDASRFGSPADCRLLAWQELDGDVCIPVKGDSFSVQRLLGDGHEHLADRFKGGSLCVCRLCPADYHRYHFPDDGRIIGSWHMPGGYHSVNPLALHHHLNVFTTNFRVLSLLQLINFGQVLFVEVGAFGVGSIHQTCQGPVFSKGQEKGYFTFGGSTIILVFEPGHIRFDDDILEHSAQNLETRILAGEAIASGI